MKIGIFGMGAVGAAIYNELNEYNDLYILCDEVRKNKYDNEGFIINNKIFYPKCINEGIMDIIIVCVKNYHLDKIYYDLSKFMDNNTILLPLLNGITAHDVLARYYPNNRVLYGVINVEANKIKNNIATSKIINLQFCDEYNYKLDDKLLFLDDLFNKYNLTHKIYEDMKKRVWLKWMLNMGINQISALTNLSYIEMTHPAIKKLMIDIFKEVYLVSRAYNIGLDDNDLLETINRIDHFKSTRVTSLTIDFNNSDENELDCFGGTLLKMANEKNIAIPANEAVYSLLKGIDDNKKQKRQI